jgi:hypothetical protein
MLAKLRSTGERLRFARLAFITAPLRGGPCLREIVCFVHICGEQARLETRRRNEELCSVAGPGGFGRC